MDTKGPTENRQSPDDFRREAEGPDRALIAEVFAFLRQTRKWWLTPIVVVLLLVGLLVVLGGTGLAPFIYTLF